MTNPDASRAHRSDLLLWFLFLANCLAMAVIIGARHRDAGLLVAFAAGLVFAFQLAFGRVGGNVFLFGFGLGVCIEFGCYGWLEWTALHAAGPLNPQTVDHFFPFTFQYGKIWPPTEVLLARGGQFDSKTALDNGLAAIAAGQVTSGFLAGILCLVAWYWLGARHPCERLIAHFRGRAHSLKQAVWQRKSGRIAVWTIYGIGIAAFILWTWWLPFGPLQSTVFAILIVALFGAIAWLDVKQFTQRPRPK